MLMGIIDMPVSRYENNFFYAFAGWALVMVPLCVAGGILYLSFPSSGASLREKAAVNFQQPGQWVKSWMFRNRLQALNQAVPPSFKEVWDIADRGDSGACRAQQFRYLKRVRDVFPRQAEDRKSTRLNSSH